VSLTIEKPSLSTIIEDFALGFFTHDFTQGAH
jgi:hypothetical protein